MKENPAKFRKAFWAVVGGPRRSLLASFWVRDTDQGVDGVDAGVTLFRPDPPQEAASRVMAY